MSLVLKMRLTSTTQTHNGSSEVIRGYRLQAVAGDENKPWSKWTPAGDLGFTVTNPDAPELEPGEYLVTLTKV